MSAMTLAAPRPLIDLLGNRWRVDARAACVAWDAKAGLAALGLSNGVLAIARLPADGGPSARLREGGGVELIQATAPPQPLARIPVHDGACVALAADPDGGFLSGGSDRQLARVQADGTIDTLGQLGDEAAAWIACGPGGWRVCGAGRTLVRLGMGARTLELPNAVTALAVAPDGARVAIGHAGGVTLWAGGDKPRRLAAKGIHTDLAWSRDARLLASATREGDVFLWDQAKGEARQIDEGHGMRRPLGLTADGRHLATGGGGVVACWDTATLGLVTCGIASKEVVLQLACHPRRKLVAAGYANGAVAICRPASAEVVFVRGAGGGGIDVLAWAPDGQALIYAVASGEIGLAVLPDLLFRDAGDAP
jgi:hypothetical protein